MPPADSLRELPRGGRMFATIFGALLVASAVYVLATTRPLTWQPVAGALALLVLGADFLIAAGRKRWPLIAPLLNLP